MFVTNTGILSYLISTFDRKEDIVDSSRATEVVRGLNEVQSGEAEEEG